MNAGECFLGKLAGVTEPEQKRKIIGKDFMTADWSRIPYEVLDKVSSRIVNEVPHVNRVLYDITSKPPSTVEFE